MATTEQPTLTKREAKLVHIMQLLGDSTRYKIFKLIMSGEKLCVSDIASRLDVSVSAVSQHFRNFEIMGLVDKERMGQRICYSMKDDNEFIEQLSRLTKEG